MKPSPSRWFIVLIGIFLLVLAPCWCVLVNRFIPWDTTENFLLAMSGFMFIGVGGGVVIAIAGVITTLIGMGFALKRKPKPPSASN